MDEGTVDLYDENAHEYLERRRQRGPEAAVEWSGRLPDGVAPVVDAGCGPGLDLPGLPDPVVGLDAAFGMLEVARHGRPAVLAVQADLAALPIRSEALRGCWSRQSHLHLPRSDLPQALADLHRSMSVGAPLRIQLLSFGRDGDGEAVSPPNDDFPGRFFASWSAPSLVPVIEGAGFEVADVVAGPVPEETHKVRVDATRIRTLPDWVGPGMRVLFCGLNPSLHAADAGFGYAGPGNRFWPAVGEVGLTPYARQPWRALRHDGIGTTDLVKRATPRAAELTVEEYRAGAERLERVVEWLGPRAVCFVGLTGYRAAVDRRAEAGWQPEGFGGVATYVMPSTSGLNTHATFADLAGHLRSVERETR